MNDKEYTQKCSDMSHSPARKLGHIGTAVEKKVDQYETSGLNSREDTARPMQVNSDGKVIDPNYRWLEGLNFDEYIDKTGMLPANKALLKRFVHEARMGKTIKKGAKKKIERARLVKYVQDLKKLDAFCKKPLDAVTMTDMEGFIIALENGELKQSCGKPYSRETQVVIKKILIKFYRWLNGGYNTPELVTWLDTSYKLKDYRAPKQEQVELMLNNLLSKTTSTLNRNRAIISMLFDGGFRADELLNLRNSHVWKDKGLYWARIEFSKTKKRTMNLPLSTTHLDRWVSMHPNRSDPDAQFFQMTYTALRLVVKRAGKGIGVKLTPHSLRHGSATYWAKHLSRYQLCHRMGWALSSRQPDRYIDQEGLETESTMKVVEQTNLSRLEAENAELKRQFANLSEMMARILEQDKQELRTIIAAVRAENH